MNYEENTFLISNPSFLSCSQCGWSVQKSLFGSTFLPIAKMNQWTNAWNEVGPQHVPKLSEHVGPSAMIEPASPFARRSIHLKSACWKCAQMPGMPSLVLSKKTSHPPLRLPTQIQRRLGWSRSVPPRRLGWDFGSWWPWTEPSKTQTASTKNASNDKHQRPKFVLVT